MQPTRPLAAEDGELDWQRLRELCQVVVALRRGDHSAARLKIEQARREREREETEEKAVAHFQRWANNPKVRELICGPCRSAEEQEQQMRSIFGLTPAETSKAAHASGDTAAAKAEALLQSIAIQPNQAGQETVNDEIKTSVSGGE